MEIILTKIMHVSLVQYIIISYTILLPIILNLYSLNIRVASFILGGVFLIFQSLVIGQQFFKKRHLYDLFILGAFIFSLGIIILSSLFYYIWDYSLSIFSLVLIITPLIIATYIHYTSEGYQSSFELFELKWSYFKLSRRSTLLVILYILVIGYSYISLINNSTVESITSPWNSLGPDFWLSTFLSTVILLIISFSI